MSKRKKQLLRDNAIGTASIESFFAKKSRSKPKPSIPAPLISLPIPIPYPNLPGSIIENENGNENENNLSQKVPSSFKNAVIDDDQISNPTSPVIWDTKRKITKPAELKLKSDTEMMKTQNTGFKGLTRMDKKLNDIENFGTNNSKEMFGFWLDGQNQISNIRKHVQFCRLLILNIVCSNSNSNSDQILIGIIENRSDSKQKYIHLREDWARTKIEIGNIVNVISDDIDSNSIILTNSHGFIIVEPDIMVSGTRLAGSFSCSRRTVIEDRISIAQISKPMMFGNIIHELIEQCMLKNDFSLDLMEKYSRLLIKDNIRSLVYLDSSIESFYKEIEENFTVIQEWSDKLFKKGNYEIQIVNVDNTEESIWSPAFGLKGILDGTIHLEIRKFDDSGELESVESFKKAAFELKTGNPAKSQPYLAHRVQLIVYSLLLKDRYGVTPPVGLLSYSKSGINYIIPAESNEIRHLIMGRNKLVCDLKSFDLSPVLDNYESRTCKTCSVKSYCKVYNDTTVPEYFRHWDSMIRMEASQSERTKTKIWSVDIYERDIAGVGFADMIISKTECSGSDEYLVAPRFKYWFERKKKNNLLSNSSIYINDSVVIGTMDGDWGVATGFVKEKTDYSILIETRREIKIECNGLFRIDKDELLSGYKIMRANLIKLFFDSSIATRRRIVDLKPPVFEDDINWIKSKNYKYLNPMQKRAIDRVITSLDYSLVLGMPGTGKSYTIAELVECLVLSGKSVLLTSHTHNAVDNILLKLIEKDIDFTRLGHLHSINPLIKPYALDSCDELEDLRKKINNSRVVATTCLGVGHPFFLSRKDKFDVCIVDEASQVTQMACLGPCLLAERFCLVGDHYQLSPLVRDSLAQKSGMDVSLFKRLCSAHPESVTVLDYQYRMNQEIQDISSNLFYNGKLVCANSKVACKRLKVTSKSPIYSGDYPVIFIDSGSENEAKIASKIVIKYINELNIPMDSIGVLSPYLKQVSEIRDNLNLNDKIEVHTIDKFQGRDKDIIILSFFKVGILINNWKRLNVAFSRAKKKLIFIGNYSILSASPPPIKNFIQYLISKNIKIIHESTV